MLPINFDNDSELCLIFTALNNIIVLNENFEEILQEKNIFIR